MGTLLHIEFGGTSPQDEHDRLTREIWRLQQQLARLTEAVLSGAPPEGFDDSDTAGRVGRILKLRTSRRRIFDAELFGEPAWDMLLQLYDAQLRGRTHCIADLCAASGIPPSAALRWIQCLVDGNWISKRCDPCDRQHVIVSLSPKGADAMQRFFSQSEFTGGLSFEATEIAQRH